MGSFKNDCCGACAHVKLYNERYMAGMGGWSYVVGGWLWVGNLRARPKLNRTHTKMVSFAHGFVVGKCAMDVTKLWAPVAG